MALALGGTALAGAYFFRNQIKTGLSSGVNTLSQDLTQLFSIGSNLPATQQANVQTGASGGQVLPNGAQVY